MVDRKFDPTEPYFFAQYGRMSDFEENKRSPDQDDSISGRYLRRRPVQQRMLRDIESEMLEIHLLVVDTLERLGQADEIAELRRKLFVHYSILIVAADTGFSDPN